MKKVFLSFMLGMSFLLFGAADVEAKMYILKPKPTTPAPFKPRMPAFHPVLADIDAETGELTVLFNTAISSAEITIAQNGVVYESDTISAVYGQTFVYDMSSYDEGDYSLLITAEGNVISEFTISIEEE